MMRIIGILLIVYLNMGAVLGQSNTANLVFNTVSHYRSGTTVDADDQFSYYVALTLGSPLFVSASGDLKLGGNSIPISNFTLLLKGIRNSGVSLNLTETRPIVTLSTSYQEFYRSLTIGLLSTLYFSFTYATAGGAAFLNKPPGVYTTQLSFRAGPSVIIGTGQLSVTINNVGTISAINTQVGFGTVANYLSGINETKSNLLYNVFSNQPYKIQVRALAGNFNNNNGTLIPINHMLISEPTATPVALSTTNQPLLGSGITIPPTIADASYQVNFKTNANNAVFLNKPPGNYLLNIIFSLTDANGNLFPGLAPATTTAGLTVELKDVLAISIQGGAETANLTFVSSTDYANGVSITQPNAFNVFSNNPYKLMVKSGSTHFGSGSSQIPVQNVSVKLTPNPTNPGLILTPVNFSTSSKNIVDGSAPGSGTLSQKFDATYFTSPGNTQFLNRPSGTYSATITYTLSSP